MSPFFILYSFIFHLLILRSSSTLADLQFEKTALIAFRSALAFRGRTLLWDTNQTTPCEWIGITCKGDRVTAIRLPAASIAGQIPLGVFRNLTHLSTVSLRLNLLTGQLPSDLGLCVELRNLYLQGNRFSGHIPEFLFNLKNLVRLDLSDNNFSGRIPVEFCQLSRLRTLYLDRNNLSGSLPELKLLKLELFNVSYNQLNGSIPPSLRSFPISAFDGNALCDRPLNTCPVNDPLAIIGVNGNDSVVKKKKKKKIHIVCVIVGSIVGVFLVVLTVYLCCLRDSKSRRRRVTRGTHSVEVPIAKHGEVGEHDDKFADIRNGGGGVTSGRYSVAAAAATALTTTNRKFEGNNTGGGSSVVKKLVFFRDTMRMFDLEDLLRASAEVLGKGTFGTSYKASMDNGIVLAVKRLKNVVATETDFREKIEVVGAMDNENILPLRGYYYSRDEKLLVCDYMPMGSLSALLHGNKGSGRTPLSWNIRSNIALGVARGIAYLHSQGSTISHGNVKSSNILLTTSYEARVSDFGLTHLVGPSSTPNRVSGYRAPEVTDPRKVSQKSDVYSFGVLLLELLTGKAPTHAILNEEGVDLPRWVQSIVREEWTSEVFDMELLRNQNAEEQMVQLLQLAIDCSAQYPDNRPSMSVVANRIDEIRRSSLQYHNPMYDSEVQDADAYDDDSVHQHRDAPPS